MRIIIFRTGLPAESLDGIQSVKYSQDHRMLIIQWEDGNMRVISHFQSIACS